MSCNCNKIQPASITPVLAAGSVASPYFVQVNISQRLCYATCVANTPVFAPKFSLRNVSQVGTSQYMLTIHVEGIISYTQCKGGCNCTRQQPLSQDFTIPLTSATAPNVTISAGSTVNSVPFVDCQICSRNFVSETPLTITVA